MADQLSIGLLFETPLVIDRMSGDEQAAVEQGEAHQLDARIGALADRHTTDTGSPSGARYGWSSNVQVHRGKAIFPHFNPGAMWTILCFGKGEGGRLILEDPRLPMIMMEAPKLRIRDNPALPPLEHYSEIRGQPGLVAMFPGWLRFSVDEQSGPIAEFALVARRTAVIAGDGPAG